MIYSALCNEGPFRTCLLMRAWADTLAAEHRNWRVRKWNWTRYLPGIRKASSVLQKATMARSKLVIWKLWSGFVIAEIVFYSTKSFSMNCLGQSTAWLTGFWAYPIKFSCIFLTNLVPTCVTRLPITLLVPWIAICVTTESACWSQRSNLDLARSKTRANGNEWSTKNPVESYSGICNHVEASSIYNTQSPVGRRCQNLFWISPKLQQQEQHPSFSYWNISLIV